MVEFRVQPVVRAVAGIASHGKLARRVIRVVGVQIIGLVARIAVGRHGLELAGGPVLVAGIAVNRGMRSGEGKPIIVILDLLDRDLPSPDRVALLAIGPQLAPVDIGVAVLATLPNAAENWFDMALCAGYRLVHAAKRIARLIVIEFRNRPDRLPAAGRVAILTGNVQISVWAVSATGSLRRCASRCPGKR
jgi:hypothetical protein